MIKSIRLQNFFGFQDCTINLEKGANVLVGINGSGKSNFFKAIRLLIAANTSSFFYNLALSEFGGYEGMSNLQREDYDPIDIEFHLDGGLVFGNKHKTEEIVYRLTFKKVPGNSSYSLDETLILTSPKTEPIDILSFKDGTGRFLKSDSTENIYENHDNFVDRVAAISKFYGDPKGNLLSVIIYYLEQIEFYEPFLTNRYSPIRMTKVIVGANKLSPDGGNLASLLQTLKVTNRKTYTTIREKLKSVNENFIDFDYIFVGGGNVELQIRERDFLRPTPIQHISDGTLRFLCLMAILYNPNRGTVVCIDEPELGLHPDMIYTVAEAIKYAAETSQVIISTHSPELLNHFEVENIRVFEKDEHNATIVNQYKSEEFNDFMDKYMAGQLWRQGHLGGNRW